MFVGTSGLNANPSLEGSKFHAAADVTLAVTVIHIQHQLWVSEFERDETHKQRHVRSLQQSFFGLTLYKCKPIVNARLASQTCDWTYKVPNLGFEIRWIYIIEQSSKMQMKLFNKYKW